MIREEEFSSPWRIVDDSENVWPKRILAADGTVIGSWGPSMQKEMELIVNAPEMYDVLKSISEYPQSNETSIEARYLASLARHVVKKVKVGTEREGS